MTKTRPLSFSIAHSAKFTPKPMPGDQRFQYVVNEPTLFQRIVNWFMAPAW